jgi:hypothetical protein
VDDAVGDAVGDAPDPWLASSWLISPEDLLAADSADPYSSERLAVHRAAIVEAARRLCAPTP